MPLPRTRRPWSTLRTEIRRFLKEPTARFWDDVFLLQLANASVDEYTMLMIAQDEGWMNDTLEASLIANEVKYALPEGTGTVRSVCIVHDPGGNDEIVWPLLRDDRLTRAQAIGSSFSFAADNELPPTYRLVGNLIYLSRPPDRSVTNGLQIEAEFAPPRLVADGDMLDKRFPDVFETLLTYDVTIKALEMLLSQGNNASAAAMLTPLKGTRDNLARAYANLTQRRQKSPTFSRPFSTGA